VGGPRKDAAHGDGSGSHITQYSEKLKWKRLLEWALDAVLEAEFGDLGLIQLNLVEAGQRRCSESQRRFASR
jgi:hypothetical protein